MDERQRNQEEHDLHELACNIAEDLDCGAIYDWRLEQVKTHLRAGGTTALDEDGELRLVMPEVVSKPQDIHEWWRVTLRDDTRHELDPEAYRDIQVYANSRGAAITRAYQHLDNEHERRVTWFSLVSVATQKAIDEAEAEEQYQQQQAEIRAELAVPQHLVW